MFKRTTCPECGARLHAHWINDPVDSWTPCMDRKCPLVTCRDCGLTVEKDSGRHWPTGAFSYDA